MCGIWPKERHNSRSWVIRLTHRTHIREDEIWCGLYFIIWSNEEETILQKPAAVLAHMILVSLQRGREGVDDMLPIYHGSLRNEEKTWECPSQPLPYKLDESRLLQSLAAKRRVFYTYLMQLKRRINDLSYTWWAANSIFGLWGKMLLGMCEMGTLPPNRATRVTQLIFQ